MLGASATAREFGRLQFKDFLRRTLARGISIEVQVRRCRAWITATVTQTTERTNRIEPLLIESDTVGFEDRAGLLFEIRQLRVVLQQGLRLGADRISPIGDALQEVQQDRSPVAILGVLELQVRFGPRRGRRDTLRTVRRIARYFSSWPQ